MKLEPERILAIIVVGGAAKDIGKTALTCAVIAALPEFQWTAVKITGHNYDPAASAIADRTVWEETNAGEDTDTGRYLLAGARRALLITRSGAEPPIDEIRKSLGHDRNVIFESNRIIGAIRPDLCLALIGRRSTDRKASFDRLLSVADAVVTLDETQIGGLPASLPRFRFLSTHSLSAEMVSWLRTRLNALSQPGL